MSAVATRERDTAVTDAEMRSGTAVDVTDPATRPDRATAAPATPADDVPGSVAVERAPTAARRWWPRLLWAVGLVIAAIALRAALPELREGINALGHAHTGLLTVAVAVEVAALATLPLTFRAALAMLGGDARYGAALDGTLGAFALSRVVPGGGLAGGVYAARRFMRAGNSAAVAGAAVAVASAATMVTLGVVVAGGAVTEAATGRGSIGLVWSMAGFLAVLAAIAVVIQRILRDPERIDALCTRVARLLRRPDAAGQWRDHLQTIAAAMAHPRPLVRVVGWSALNWALQLLALWTIFAAFGVSMPVGVLVLGFGAANLVTALPHTPGGLGVVEAGMTATYVAMGVPMSTALVGVLCYRLLGHWLPVMAALPLVLPHVKRARGSEA
jgi:hypothetical protein